MWSGRRVLKPCGCREITSGQQPRISLLGRQGRRLRSNWARRVLRPALRQVSKRGAPPGGGGEVFVRIPNLKQLPPVNLTDEGGRCVGG